jgi:hypothetical protein
MVRELSTLSSRYYHLLSTSQMLLAWTSYHDGSPNAVKTNPNRMYFSQVQLLPCLYGLEGYLHLWEKQQQVI